jgi:membrane protease YdiL (CAAX protease family)
MAQLTRERATAIACALVLAAAWIASAAYLAMTGANLRTAVISMAVVGLALPALAVALTRRTEAPAVPVERPARDLVFVLAYLVAYAFYFLGWAIGAIRAATQAGFEQDLLLLILKLGVGVSAPAVLLYLLGAQLGPLFDAGRRRRGFWPTLLIIGPILTVLAVLASGNPGVARTLALPPAVLLWAAPYAFVWVGLEALSEEFLYRAVLQSRLAAVLRSQVGAVMISALLFSLAHVPGIFLRSDAATPGHSSDLLRVLAYCVGVMTPIGILYGTIWARTRSLLLVILVHAWLSFAPRIADLAAAVSP